MQLIHDVAALRRTVRGWQSNGERVALVPTMGNLHAGHLSLVRQAAQLADRVVISVFVNPMQFGEGEDFEAYPRTLEADCRSLDGQGADVVFAPGVETMYPGGAGAATRVEPPVSLTDMLCGEARPGHFTGVATIVAKLFNLVGPDLAVFGRKDFQQLQVIRRMAVDLNFPLEVHGCPIVREPDGLAMSSRNAYLTEDERRRAPALAAALRALVEAVRQGERDVSRLEAEARNALEEAGLGPDYISLRRGSDLADPRPGDRQLVVLGAARLGRARLIDNIEFEVAGGW